MKQICQFLKRASKLVAFLLHVGVDRQGDLDDAREITTVWTYFRDNQVD